MNRLTTFAVAMLTGLVLAGPAHAAVQLTGTYDPADDNDVDQSGTFLSATGSASAANVVDVTTFTTSVATAFGNGTGGVISFDAIGDAIDVSGTTLTTSVFGGATLTMNAPDSGGTALLGAGSGSGGRLPTSGQTGSTDGGRLGQTGGRDFVFDSFVFSGAAGGTKVTSFGATLVHRQHNGSWNATATFSDGSTLVFNDVAFAETDTANTLDTFFGAVAPTDTWITSFIIETTTASSNTWLDDVGFTTAVVPEPSSIALVGLGGLITLVRRRRS